MKTIYKLTIAVWSVLLFSNCSDETLDQRNMIQEGEPTSISLKFEVKNAPQLSRATSPVRDEYKVNNLYVFIFNPDGSLSTSQFFDYHNLNNKVEKTEITHVTTSGNVRLETVSGTGKMIWAIANIDNQMRDVTQGKLDEINNLQALRDFTATLNQNTIARGTNFLMSGTTETPTIDIPVGNDVEVFPPITLKRVDAKITFNIETASGVTFTPSEWKVVKASKTVSLLPSSEDPTTNEKDYFESPWINYEGEGDNFGRTFSFYVAENRKAPKQTIPTEKDGSLLTPEQQYAYREKQEKIPLPETPNNDRPGQIETNGKYVHANDNSTYVIMKGNITYQYNEDQEVSADVVYTIHLGFLNNNANDFNTYRNTHYTYTVTIINAENIIIEVNDEKENQPGAEGEIIIANNILQLDSHYEVRKVNFTFALIDPSLTWYVKTAFSEGMPEANPKDYQWIKFRLNNKNGTAYTPSFQSYPGKTENYTDQEIKDLNYLITSDKLVDVDQLVRILKENKTKQINDLPSLFDGGQNITFTAFIEENYYEENPQTGERSTTLWKHFVNQPERIMNILSQTKYSPDGESVRHVAVTSFRQKSIQTMYNVNAGNGLQTAWGTECEQETGKRPFWNQAHDNTNPTYNNTRNGRANTIKLWEGASWNYVDQSKNQMQDEYNYARYNCMQRNRDLNGNGTIDPDEIRWYLAAIDQLTDLWIGENSFDADARLFKGTTWIEDWYVSSTVSERYYQFQPFPFQPSWWDNPVVLWSSEGSSIGKMNNVPGYNRNMSFNYRCVRNLGVDQTNPDNAPQDFATYDPASGILSLEYLNEKSIRAYTQTNELPEHHERQADNLPWLDFEVNSRSHLSNNSALNWVEMCNTINAGNSPCPNGWRVPNQRELALMLSRIKNDGGWTLDNHMSRTRFSMNPTSSYRHGFSISNQAGILYLINNSSEKGGVRCVRDVQKQSFK